MGKTVLTFGEIMMRLSPNSSNISVICLLSVADASIGVMNVTDCF